MPKVVTVLEQFEELASYRRQAKLKLANSELRLEEVRSHSLLTLSSLYCMSHSLLTLSSLYFMSHSLLTLSSPYFMSHSLLTLTASVGIGEITPQKGNLLGR